MAEMVCKRCSYVQNSGIDICLRCGLSFASSKEQPKVQKAAPNGKSGTAKSVRRRSDSPRQDGGTPNPTQKSKSSSTEGAKARPAPSDKSVPSNEPRSFGWFYVLLGIAIFVVILVYSELHHEPSTPASSTRQSQSAEVPYETIPNVDSRIVLTTSEHIFCLGEEYRLEGMADHIRDLRQLVMYYFYQGAFGDLCPEERIDVPTIEQVLPSIQSSIPSLKEQGRLRLTGDSTLPRDQEFTRYMEEQVHFAYVTADVVNVRSAPSVSSDRITQLEGLHEVVAIDEPEGDWQSIVFFKGDEFHAGYVASRLISIGTEQEAAYAYCEVGEGQRPPSGYVFERADSGENSITVTAADKDTLVRIKGGDSVVLTFFVRANDAAWIDDIPDGSFQVMFATGTGFSRKCIDFIGDINVSGTDQPVRFRSVQVGSRISYTDMHFDLNVQRQGNFRPRTYSADEFRR